MQLPDEFPIGRTIVSIVQAARVDKEQGRTNFLQSSTGNKNVVAKAERLRSATRALWWAVKNLML